MLSMVGVPRESPILDSKKLAQKKIPRVAWDSKGCAGNYSGFTNSFDLV